MKLRHILRLFCTCTLINKDRRPGAVTNMIGASLSSEKALKRSIPKILSKVESSFGRIAGMMDSITMVGGGMLEAGKASRIQEQREGPCRYYMLRVQTLSRLRGIQPGANRLERVRGG